MSVRSSARRPVRERVRQVTAAAILDAAEAVAARRGLEATSIAAIADHAGVAVGTLYNYFPDRDALLAALFAMRRAQLVPQIAAAADATRKLPFERRLRAFLGDVVDALERARPFCTLAMSTDPSTLKIKGKPALAPAIVSALADILQPVTGVASLEYAHAMYGALKQLLWLRLERREPLVDVAPLVADAFLRGIRKR